MNRHRVTISPKSFDIEKLVGVSPKTGEPQWHKVAYYRTKAGLLAGLRSRGLPESLASRMPDFHDDAVAALEAFSRPSPERKKKPKPDSDPACD